MSQRSSFSWTSMGLAGVSALFGTWGCSVLYDFNTHQCDTTQDCLHQGPQFINSVCQDHVCVQTAGSLSGGAPSFGGATNGGASFSGGAPTGGGSSAIVVGGAGTTLGGSGGMVASGGIPTAGDASTGGAPVTGGAASTGGAATGGASSGPECVTNADCFALHNDQASICRSGSCVMLTTPNCPVLIPAATATKWLKEQAPIIVGGFSNLTNATEPHSSTSVVNWDLAFAEFNTTLNPGLPGYPAGTAFRPFVGVICQGYDNSVSYPGAPPRDITKSIAHLVDEIGVTSVLSAMSATDLYTAFNLTITRPPNPDFGVFFMNTGVADLKLVNTPNDGKLFHMLGDPHMLSSTIVALFHQMEPQIYKQRLANFQAIGQDNPDAVPLRVTMVHSDYQLMSDSRDVLKSNDADHPESHLSFNGKSWTQNTVTDDAREAPTVTSNAPSNDPTIATAIAEIQAHPPHVILGIATPEFAHIMNTVEAQWASTAPNQIRPYYVLSSSLYHARTLETDTPKVMLTQDSRTPPLRLRAAGVAYASAQDERSQGNMTTYLNSLTLANPGTSLTLAGYENNYDGAYYLLYAISAAAAHRAGTPSATDIRTALTDKVIRSTGTIVDIGPEKIAATVISNFFKDPTYTMALWGTMGFPNFDSLLGTRVSQTSAWCCQKNTKDTWDFMADGLIYDPVAQTLSPNKNGMPACIQDFCPQNADAGVGTCPESY